MWMMCDCHWKWIVLRHPLSHLVGRLVHHQLGCPAVPVGIEPGGEIGLAAVDGLGTDCFRCGMHSRIVISIETKNDQGS
eukprot:3287037-Amphidinium_carterae.1